MSEARGAGATRGQIEAAARDYHGIGPSEPTCPGCLGAATEWAQRLVPPSAVIAEAADVAALSRLMVFVTAHDALKDSSGSSSQWAALIHDMWLAREAVPPDDLARLAALIERAKGGG